MGDDMKTSHRADEHYDHLFTNLEEVAGLSPDHLGCSGEIPLDDEEVSIEADAIAFDVELEVEWVGPRLA
jgi:hypothetical protein